MEANGIPDPAVAAAEAIAAATATMQITTGGGPGAELPPVVFDRYSVERRLLSFITDDVDQDALGPMNSLAALTAYLMTDRNTTAPPDPLPRLDIEGKAVAEIASEVLGMLNQLVEAGLVSTREDGAYEVTDAGREELSH